MFAITFHSFKCLHTSVSSSRLYHVQNEVLQTLLNNHNLFKLSQDLFTLKKLIEVKLRFIKVFTFQG